MSEPVSDLRELFRSMEPVLNEGVYVYCCLPLDSQFKHIPAIATFREKEGITLIVEESIAKQSGLPILFRAAWITLNVNSDLNAVGLTAAFSRALSDAGISCNVIAAAHHDHIFVPIEDGDKALEVLRKLQALNS